MIYKLNKVKNNQGFSLMEIMIALALIVVVGTGVFVNLLGRYEKGKIDQAKISITRLADAVNMFYMDCGYYPSSAEGLEALIIAPQKCESWGPAYLTKGKIPKDPWKNDFIYEYDTSTDSFEIISLGKGGKQGGEDSATDLSSKNL